MKKTLSESKRALEHKAEEAKLKAEYEAYAVKKYTAEQIAKWSNAHKGIFYLALQDENGKIIKFAVMKKITREILDYATEKLQSAGLYVFLESVMREVWLEGDSEILDDDEYFIPAAQQINKMLEGHTAKLVKR